MAIKDLPAFDRPREKLAKYGPGKLTDAELLAILLRSGTKQLDALGLAKKVLKKIGKKGFQELSIESLGGMPGLGKVKAIELLASLEFGKRMLTGKQSSIILSPKDVWERMADLRASKKEHFVVFYLDSRDQEIKREVISTGTLDESLVHPREVFEGAVSSHASSVIVAHNHPSGAAEASQADIEVTHRLERAGKILGIRLVAHIVVTDKAWRKIEF